MLIAIVAVIVNLPIVSASQGADPNAKLAVAPLCQNVGPHMAAGEAVGDGALFRRRDTVDKPAAHALSEEPPADAIATVLYTEGNCSKPMVISRGIGAPPSR